MAGRGKVIVILLSTAALAVMIGSASLAGPETDYPQIAQHTDDRDPEVRPPVGPVKPERLERARPPGTPGPVPGIPRGRGGQFRPEQVERMERMIGLIKRMQHICFDPATAGMIAIGGLKDEVRRKQEAVVADLEGQLAKTKTLGLRNAIRMMLKDLYKARGDDEKVLGHLRKMIEENDAALSKERGRRATGPSPRKRGPARDD